MPDNNRPHGRKALLVPLLVLLADIATKELARSHLSRGCRVLIKGVLDLGLVENTGVAFGLLRNAGNTLIIILTAALTVFFFVLFLREASGNRGKLVIPYGLILGGATGNLLERILRGVVTDFIDLHWKTHHWPSFNLADTSITVGMGLLMLAFLKQERGDEPP